MEAFSVFSVFKFLFVVVVVVFSYFDLSMLASLMLQTNKDPDGI